MRESSSSFDVARIVRELSEMIGSRARKAYQPHYEQIVLRLNRKGISPIDLVVVSGKRVYLSRRDRPMPSRPSHFAMVLRKHLNNSRLISVEQFGFDRVIRLVFEHGRGKLSLIIEMFRDGNIILLDGEDKIIQPLTHAKFASRSIKRGISYIPPPETFDPRVMKIEDFALLIKESNHDLIRTLAARANLGRIYGSAACHLSEINEKVICNTLEFAEIEKLYNSVKKMLEFLSSGEGSMIWMKDTRLVEKWDMILRQNTIDDFSSDIVEIAPINLPNMDDNNRIEVSSLSFAFDCVFGPHDAAAYIRREEEKFQSSKNYQEIGEKLVRREKQQRTAIQKFLDRAEISQKLGLSIQDNWNHVDSIIAQSNAAVKRDGWDSVSEKIYDIPWIGEINPSKKTIIAYLPDEDNDPGASITLEIEKTVHQNAQRYFEDARNYKNKAKGAESALLTTEELRRKEEKRDAKNLSSGLLKKRVRSKKLWFEKHRWAILEKGNFLIGGRDSKGNDIIVKKHLSSRDLYFHADLHGAPSCSLKLKDGLIENDSPSDFIPDGVVSLILSQNLCPELEDAREMSESDFVEAAQIAVCWSRAWGSGGAAATAFYVRSSQVSKTTETGESLSQGSFVIRGKRNWFRDLALELGIGIGIVNGVPLPITGTPKTISKKFPRWVKISPGREKKESIANIISKKTGLSQEDLLSCLPPGNCSIEDYGLINQ